MHEINLHGDSYDRFWQEEFPKQWADAISNALMRCQQKYDSFAFTPKIKDVSVELEDSHLQVPDPETFCRNRRLDLTQHLTIQARLSDYGGLPSFYLGEIPRLTQSGTFIIGGIERMLLAQLVNSPGLYIHAEHRSKKYRVFNQSYEVQKIVYKAQIVPHYGTWLEFEIARTDPAEQLDKFNSELRARVTKDDGWIRVRVRRAGRWFDVFYLLLALGMPASEGPESSEELDEEGEGEDVYLSGPLAADDQKKLNIIAGWRRLASSLRLGMAELNDEQTREAFTKILLTRNNLSALGRYQINRRLARLRRLKSSGVLPNLSEFQLPAENAHNLCADDILGVMAYLKSLHDGCKLPLDSRRCLANKRVRLAGDLLAEEVVPAVLYTLAQALEERIARAFKNEEPLDEEAVTGFIRQACSTGEKTHHGVTLFLSSSELSQLVPQHNQLAREALNRRITLFGPGGLESSYVQQVRDIHWSHYGRFCPVDTPQSDRLGSVLSVPLEARINDLGLLSTPYYPITQNGGNRFDIAQNAVYLSAADEEEDPGWIAYFDQRDALIRGEDVWARRGPEEYCRVSAREISYIDASPHQQFSIAARSIPFLQHNDANRVLMACSAMRQALPLQEPECPWIHTGIEQALSSTPWPLGRNLLVAYMPFKGLNFEDAIVVSQSASRKLTSLHWCEYHIPLKEHVVTRSLQTGGIKGKKSTVREKVCEITFRDVPKAKIRGTHLNDDGIVRLGSWVKEGDVLVGIIEPRLKEKYTLGQWTAQLARGQKVPLWDRSFVVPKGERGQVIEVEAYLREPFKRLPPDVWKLIRIKLQIARPLEVGDKITNRHGGKGVVSCVRSDEEMPYFLDPSSDHDHDGIGKHRHVEVIINPLSVISRLNPAQLYETHLGWIAAQSGQTPHPPISPFTDDSWQLISQANQRLEKNFLENGKASLMDLKARRELCRATVGYQYLLKLDHLAQEKVHGRGYPKYNYQQVSLQPLQGKKSEGGQRLGEMEFWALEAYDARHIIQEMLTLRSDNPDGRDSVFRSQISSHGNIIDPQAPQFLKVLSLFLLAMGLELEFVNSKGKTLNLLTAFPPISPEEIAAVRIRPVKPKTIENMSSGEISEPKIGNEEQGYEDKGLFSQVIFGPLKSRTCKCGRSYPYATTAPGKCVKCGVEIIHSDARRTRIGHISLDYPVFNVVFTTVAATLLGLSTQQLKSFLKEQPDIKFNENLDSLMFLEILINASKDFKRRFEAKLELQPNGYTPDFAGLSKLFVDYKGYSLNYISALKTKEILAELSCIKLLGEMLEYLSDKTRLTAIRKKLAEELNLLIENEKKQDRQERIRRRLEVIDRFLQSGVLPSQMMLKKLAVLPPDLRPPFTLANGEAAWGDLNLLYKKILLFGRDMEGRWVKMDSPSKAWSWQMKDPDSPKTIRQLQALVAGLIDHRKALYPIEVEGKRCQKSLAWYLLGKEGFFRGNLLGKRVDYSGRAVIVPDPELTLDQCGLPYAMAVKIYEPLLIEMLAEHFKKKKTVRELKAMIRNTLNTSGIEPKKAAQVEEHKRSIISFLNKLGSQHPVLLNRQPTLHRLGMLAFKPKVCEHHAVTMHPLVLAGFNADFDGDTIAIHRVITPKARDEMKILFASNNLFSPADGSLALNLGQDIALGMYLYTKEERNREALARMFGTSCFVDPLSKSQLRRFLETALRSSKRPPNEIMKHLDLMKEKAFDSATESGLTLSLFDLPDFSNERRAAATHRMEDFMKSLRGHVEQSMQLDPNSSLGVLYHSEARGSRKDITNNIMQLVGMRGRMERISEAGTTSDSPVIWSSLKEGMNLGEYFVSCYGSRTTLVDKKFGTADAGYVSRQLVEITHPIRITREDCMDGSAAPPAGIAIYPYSQLWLDLRDMDLSSLLKRMEGKFVEAVLWEDLRGPKTEVKCEKVLQFCDVALVERLRVDNPQLILLGAKVREARKYQTGHSIELAGKVLGRVLAVDLLVDGDLFEAGTLISNERDAERIANSVHNHENELLIRSPLHCRSTEGVCQRCYGWDPATRNWPAIGAKVGILAAQSIGEPGTQLVLRTFHFSGVQGMADISKDIPKVQRFLNGNDLAQVEPVTLDMTSGPVTLQTPSPSYEYYPGLIDAIQSIYLKNGINISDQHYEILLRGMLNKVGVDACAGSSSIGVYPGRIIDGSAGEAGRLETAPILANINTILKTPASWLSSASFGNTVEVLSLAAIGEATDPLAGLKENIIIGKLLP